MSGIAQVHSHKTAWCLQSAKRGTFLLPFLCPSIKDGKEFLYDYDLLGCYRMVHVSSCNVRQSARGVVRVGVTLW